MSVDLNLSVPDVDNIIGTAANRYNNIRLYRASTPGGTYVLVETILLVAGDTVYPTTDPAGLSSSWYKLVFYNSVEVVESPLNEAEPFPATRDILTLKELRRKIINRLGGDVYVATGGSASTVIAELAKDTARDSNWYEGWHLFRAEANNVNDYDRRVSAYDNTNGTFTHAGFIYADATPAAETFELLPLDVNLTTLNEWIGEGLMRARYVTRFEFGVTGNRKQFALPAFIEGREHVVDAWVRSGATANEYDWTPLREVCWWDVTGSNFETRLDLSPGLSDNSVIALDVWRSGLPLYGEEDFTYVHPRWAVAAAMVEVLFNLSGRDVVRHNTSNLASLLTEWKTTLRGAAKTYGPSGGMKQRTGRPVVGFPEV